MRICAGECNKRTKRTSHISSQLREKRANPDFLNLLRCGPSSMTMLPETPSAVIRNDGSLSLATSLSSSRAASQVRIARTIGIKTHEATNRRRMSSLPEELVEALRAIEPKIMKQAAPITRLKRKRKTTVARST